MNKKIYKYIRWAGGPSHVAKQLNLSRTTIWSWQTAGFPDTDFSGRTSYAKQLAKMCRANGYQLSGETVLRAGRP